MTTPPAKRAKITEEQELEDNRQTDIALPTDIWAEIALHLTDAEALRLRRVCRATHAMPYQFGTLVLSTARGGAWRETILRRRADPAAPIYANRVVILPYKPQNEGTLPYVNSVPTTLPIPIRGIRRLIVPGRSSYPTQRPPTSLPFGVFTPELANTLEEAVLSPYTLQCVVRAASGSPFRRLRSLTLLDLDETCAPAYQPLSPEEIMALLVDLKASDTMAIFYVVPDMTRPPRVYSALVRAGRVIFLKNIIRQLVDDEAPAEFSAMRHLLPKDAYCSCTCYRPCEYTRDPCCLHAPNSHVARDRAHWADLDAITLSWRDPVWEPIMPALCITAAAGISLSADMQCAERQLNALGVLLESTLNVSVATVNSMHDQYEMERGFYRPGADMRCLLRGIGSLGAHEIEKYFELSAQHPIFVAIFLLSFAYIPAELRDRPVVSGRALAQFMMSTTDARRAYTPAQLTESACVLGRVLATLACAPLHSVLGALGMQRFWALPAVSAHAQDISDEIWAFIYRQYHRGHYGNTIQFAKYALTSAILPPSPAFFDKCDQPPFDGPRAFVMHRHAAHYSELHQALRPILALIERSQRALAPHFLAAARHFEELTNSRAFLELPGSPAQPRGLLITLFNTAGQPRVLPRQWNSNAASRTTSLSRPL